MGGVEIERADTGESLTASWSILSTLGGEMLRLSGTIVVGLSDSFRSPSDASERMEGEGAVTTGGSEGDLKRVAEAPSVVLLLSVLRTAIGKRKEGLGQKSVVVSVQQQVENGEEARMYGSRSNLVRGMAAVLLVVVYVLHMSSVVIEAKCIGRLC